MARPLGAVHGPPVHHDGAGAVEGGVHVHRALLQRHGQCDGLVGGAGLVGVLIALVPPLLVLGVDPGVGQGLAVVLLRLIAAPVLLDGGQLRLQLCLERLGVDRGEVARVVVGVGGHGQDGAGLGVHHDAGAAVGGVELIQHALQALFQIILDTGVQRQHQVAAVLRVEILLAAEQQRRAVDVGGGDGQAGAALEHVVIGGLEAVGAHLVGVDEAQHVPRQGAEGIQPLGVRRQVDALQPGGAPAGVGDEDGLSVRVDGGELVPLLVDLAVDEPPDLVGHVLVHFFSDVLVLGVGLLQLLQDERLIHLQDAGEALCDVRLIPHRRGGVGLPLLGGLLRRLLDGLLLALHILLDPVGVDEHRLRGVGDGHDLAVLVVDGPREALMTELSVCWLTARAFRSSCWRTCRSYSFQNSAVKVATPSSSITSMVRLRITWFARRAASLLRLGCSVMVCLLLGRRGRMS